MLNKLFLIIFLFFVLSSCVTQPIQEGISVSAFELSTKAQVTDKESDESHNVDIQIITLLDKAVRLDVTALFGYRVAEMTLTPQKIQMTNRERKQFIEGPFKSETLKPLFGQPFDPRLIWHVAHNRVLKDGLYYGAKVQTELLSKSPGDLFQKQKITIEDNKFKMVWLIKSKESLSGSLSYNETFILSRPDDFKLIQK